MTSIFYTATLIIFFYVYTIYLYSPCVNSSAKQAYTSQGLGNCLTGLPCSLRSPQLMSLTSAELLVEQRVAQLERVFTTVFTNVHLFTLSSELFPSDAMSYFAKCTI